MCHTSSAAIKRGSRSAPAGAGASTACAGVSLRKQPAGQCMPGEVVARDILVPTHPPVGVRRCVTGRPASHQSLHTHVEAPSDAQSTVLLAACSLCVAAHAAGEPWLAAPDARPQGGPNREMPLGLPPFLHPPRSACFSRTSGVLCTHTECVWGRQQSVVPWDQASPGCWSIDRSRRNCRQMP